MVYGDRSDSGLPSAARARRILSAESAFDRDTLQRYQRYDLRLRLHDRDRRDLYGLQQRCLLHRVHLQGLAPADQ